MKNVRGRNSKRSIALVIPSPFQSVSIPIYEAFQVGTSIAAYGILAMPERVGNADLFDAGARRSRW
jgi:hypothetical protein